MKILVTGGAGYIGSHVVLELNRLGYEVIVLDDLCKGTTKNLFDQNQFFQSNIFDNVILDKIFSQNIDVVFHFAAWKDAGESMLNPSKYAINNINGTLNLLSKMAEHNCLHFVFSSTAAVYGVPQFLPVTEDHPLEPINYYGYTKLAIEQNLSWFEKLYNMKFACLRYFNAAGYDINGNIKGLERGPANLLPVVMEVATRQREVLSIFGNDYDTPDGTCIRDYIHVSDLARAHILALDYLIEQKKSLTVNLGTKKGYSVLDVLKVTEKVIENKVNTKIVPRRKGDSTELIASFQKAQDLLNWKPLNSDLETIIRSMWNLYKTL